MQLETSRASTATGWTAEVRRRVHVMRLYTHDLRAIPEVSLRPGDSIQALEPNDYRILREIHPVDLAEEKSRLEAGHQCVVGWSDGRPAHFCWAQDSGVHRIRGTWRRETVKPGEVWLHSARTAEWARGRRLMPAALVWILRDYQSRNYARAVGTVAEWNVASIKVTEAVGFALKERIRSFAVRNALVRLPGSSYRPEGA